MARRPQGAGTIYQNSKGKWIAQLDLGTDSSGKRIRLSRSANSKKEAQAKLRDLDREAETRTTAANPGPSDAETLQAFLERWFEHKKSAWSPRTIELYRHQLKAHVYPRLGDVPLQALKAIHIQEFMTAVADTGAIPTANKCRRMIYSALKQAVRWEMIPKNPAEAVDPLPEPRKDLTLWTAEQASEFIRTHRGHRFFAAFYLLMVTGLRRGELLGLRWQDIGEEGLYVRQTVTVVGNTPTIGAPKTRRSHRYVALPKDALAVLEEHRARQIESQKLVVTWEQPELVFPSELGTVMDPRNFLRAWKKAVRTAGLPHARIHDMRHLHISRLIYLGEDAKVISDRAGHSSTSFTLDRYGHVFNEHRKRAAHSLDTLLSTPSPTEPRSGVTDSESIAPISEVDGRASRVQE